ncbi:uncharacterized protein LOC113308147 [Papaver somniferum]|uniref:uncharacterized protein LOC113308147 n=1 Tax=Papaver somniferum TaxID=3469 RepID=UPI000E6FBE84|nr:uncharacterized protein LOC113308147 [Papaver somniferum]
MKHIETNLQRRKNYMLKNMLKLLPLSTVKNLTLSRWLIKVVSEAPNLVDYESLQLSSVQSLTLRPFLSKDCFRTITYLLNISPNLESLEVIINKSPFNDEPELYPFCDEINIDSPDTGDDWETGLSLPCMLHHLKVVEICNVEGR